MAAASARTIAIIDDDDDVRESMRLLLDSFGYTVQDHASAEGFLACKSGQIDCLVVDHHMPGMSGAELLEHLHMNCARTPALMVTGRADHVIEARVARLGVKLLYKPVPEDQLIECIEQACRTKQGEPAAGPLDNSGSIPGDQNGG